MLNTSSLTEQERLTLLDAISAYRTVRTEDRPWMRLGYDERMSPAELDVMARALLRAGDERAALDERAAFFYEHAGYSYQAAKETAEEGRKRCARELAVAEEYALTNGWDVRTETDPDGPMDDDAGSVQLVAAGEAVCLIVSLYDDDDLLLGSIGNVIVSSETDDYVRVVGAELASEAMPETKE